MGNVVNSFDFTTTLGSFLASSIGDGTYNDLLATLKFDQIGQEAATTDITAAAGQLWSNLSDDYVIATYPTFYKGTKVWRVATDLLRDSLGSDDGLAVDDVAYVDATNVLSYAVSVDGASASTWLALPPNIPDTNVLEPVLSVTPGASEDNYDPGGVWPAVKTLRVEAAVATGTTLTGLRAGADNQQMLMVNTSSLETITLEHDDVASAPGLRFLLAGGLAAAIPSDGSCYLYYDGISAAWRCTS